MVQLRWTYADYLGVRLSALALCAAGAALAAGHGLGWPGSATGESPCDLVAAPTGSDAATGTPSEPLRTAQRLAGRLQPGQRGCLRGGTYREDLRIDTPRITVTASPGERPTVRGRMWIAAGADGATISNLRIDARNERMLPSPTVNAARVTLQSNDITSHRTGITCVLLGSNPWGHADHARIVGNRIHDCGDGPQPRGHGHGLYAAETSGAEIIGNVIYDNANRGIQLYPNAQRTLIRGNVLDANGENVIFSGDGETSSSDNLVVNNVITNSRVRWNVEHYWAGGAAGTGNVVRSNCIAGGVKAARDPGGLLRRRVGWHLAGGNLLRVPGYLARARGDFRLRPGSPCRGKLVESGAPLASDALEPRSAR